MEDIGRRKGKMKGGKSEGEMNHERLWTLRNKLRVLEEGWGGGTGLPGDGYSGGHLLHGAPGVIRKQ